MKAPTTYSALFSQTSSDPGGISASIEHPEYRRLLIRDAVVDAVGESLHHHPVISESERMDSCVQSEGINLGEKRIKK